MNVYPLEPPPQPHGPLAGLGIIVTRPARQAGAFASKLATLGATPIVFPAIVILPPADRASLDAIHARLADYHLAVFVSANAVEYGVPDPARWPTEIESFAPGLGTATALADAGIANVSIPATTFDSEGLLALPSLAKLEGRRVVLFRGERGRDLIASTLRERGASVDEVACYRRSVPISGADGLIEALREGRADALTVTSSEGVDNLWKVVGEEGRRLLSALPVFAPHARIAQRARKHSLDVVETAAGDAGLIAGLLEWARSNATPPGGAAT